MTLADFAVAVARYRNMTNASVNSWGRSATYNAALRGERHSLHLVDLAVDVTYDAAMPFHTVQALAEECGLRIRRERSHDHLEPLTTES